jgi:DNA-binding SARP family transcriptional activator
MRGFCQVNEATAADLAPGSWRELRLLGHFRLAGAQHGALGNAGQRLLALLAVSSSAVARWHAAQLLYPQSDEAQAAANLRAALWRLQRCCPGVLIATSTEIRLAAGLTVDYLTAMRAARMLLDRTRVFDARELAEAMSANLREDLLLSWPEPWLVAERERFHQLRLHALEILCEKLTNRGWHGAAVDAGLAAVGGDPLRESARCALIDAYLAEGNSCEAVRQIDDFRELLAAELGLQPSSALLRRMATAAAGDRRN